MESTRITELAAIISTNTAIVNTYLQSNSIPTPSFSPSAPLSLGIPKQATNIDNARRAALSATIELQDLLQGPTACLRPVLNGASLQAIYTYDIASKVPLECPISFSDLSKECGIAELDLRRILRYAMCWHRVFCEPEKGFVAHTTASRLLREDPRARDMAGLMFDGCWQGMARVSFEFEGNEDVTDVVVDC
jgi:hypothetical protein